MPTHPKSSRAGRFPTGHECILLAEDDEQVRLLVKTTLEKKGYTVMAAPSGIAAAAILASTNAKPVDLLVADLLMPRDFSGLELSEHVRERYPAVRTLYMSGYPADKLPDGLMLEPGAHFIHKPFSIQDLLTAVRRRLDE